MEATAIVNTNYQRPPTLSLEFGVGSLGELRAMLAEDTSELQKLIVQWAEITEGGQVNVAAGTTVVAGVSACETDEGGKRKRRTKLEMEAARLAAVAPVAPVVAHAPPPMPIPGATPATVDHTPNKNGTPAFLDRTPGINPPPFVAPPPLAPPAMPATPSVPPNVGKGSAEIIAKLKLYEGADGGVAIVNWMLDPAHNFDVLNKGATFVEACAAIQFTPNDKLAKLAAALGLTIPA